MRRSSKKKRRAGTNPLPVWTAWKLQQSLLILKSCRHLFTASSIIYIYIYISIKYSIYSKNLNDLHSNQIASGRRLTRPRNSPRPASKVSQGPSSVSESEPLLHSPSQPPQLISLKTGSSWRRSLPEGVLGILQRSFPANPCTQ